MNRKIGKWIRVHYDKVIGSIAFYPIIIALFFLLLSWLMLKIDFSQDGKYLKEQINWISLKDADTARTIVSTIVASIISLTVFSFSMVMIVLTQAASQMSNRVLHSMIENRYQQIVLGFYIGSAVYALFLLSTIRDLDEGVNVPAMSIYLLILFTIVDVFLFIYFLDYVTQWVKYETVIHRVKKETLASMQKLYTASEEKKIQLPEDDSFLIQSELSGYFQGYDRDQLIKLAEVCEVEIYIMVEIGDYVIKGTDIVQIFGKTDKQEFIKKRIYWALDFFSGQPLDIEPFYGFRHLTEVALKALSPGINDPATAVLSLHALCDLFHFHQSHFKPNTIKCKQGKDRVLLNVSSFEKSFKDSIYPIWQYGKNDRYIQLAIIDMLRQLMNTENNPEYKERFQLLMDKTKDQLSKNDF